MRQLNIYEIEQIAGGDIVDAIIYTAMGTALVVGTVALISTPSPRVGYRYDDVCTNYDVVTPVYDAFGIYQGDVVDTFTSCTTVATPYYY